MTHDQDDSDDDLSEFYGVFFDEADEHLTTMEALLLGIDLMLPDPEQVNAIFRAAHSIKGGAGIFGFSDLAELTHEMETVFDRVRKRQMDLSNELVNVFLRCGDTLKTMVSVRRGTTQTGPTTQELADLCLRLRVFLEPSTAPDLIKEPHFQIPPPENADALKDAIADVNPSDDVYIGEPGSNRLTHSPCVRTTDPFPIQQPNIAAVPAKATAAQSSTSGSDASSIRVSVQKVDQLINLVGELVITQSMLAQTALRTDPAIYEQLINGLAQLQRNTRDLQESAMSIRMLPISFVFGRFPRVVRDLANQLKKQVELRTEGESTELDKGLIERIVDPLTHLVRNSLDHGIESPAARVALGKPAIGTITLSAFHRGGNIMIEVTDDGGGLDRERLLNKARERGMPVSDAMTDQEVFQLIFEAGFSTADTVTDISGRGVGMDVVRRNIREMGGNVEINSARGSGTQISIRLPLTLAILEGMSVSVGQETFILPLTHIIESLQPTQDQIKTIGGQGRIVQVRGEYLPVITLFDVFKLRSEVEHFHQGIIVVLEEDGNKIALFVDALLGQHQVVIKSLETNYRRVHGISGATIMGDGRVALILDVAGLIASARPLYAQVA